jgi:DNA-binding MarR family transcriptional regulator
MAEDSSPPDAAAWFALFTEIGIIAQLSQALLGRHLPDGLTADHYAVLNHLHRVRDGATPLDMARAFQVPKTTMTHRLAVLEAAGMVQLAPNPEDGRSKRVWLTEAGRRLREAAMVRLAPDIARVAGRLPPDAVSGLLPGLRLLRAVLDADRDAERGEG